MLYPNKRYGNPEELKYWAMGIPLNQLAHRLRRSERCIKDWLTGREKIPFWVPELLRLQNMEHEHIMWQMGIAPLRKKLGLVDNGQIILLPALKPKSTAPEVRKDITEMTLKQANV
ncbi:hypothetical protein LT85_2542 [Collimonas arenae]|uniref:Uncharacterized protein n=1 Tax=Collimonas arenae TaxID=279058 RepID=A0A0A1FD47_9BURK|nr:hypothetical protein [Collimonas arenae]AIY41700.1 hypothetical protein LT85_2542 [Collimonas arenae]